MKKKKIFFCFALLLMVFLCPSVVMADLKQEGSEGKIGDVDLGACPNCYAIVSWKSQMAYGYRVYIIDAEENVLARTTFYSALPDISVYNVLPGEYTRKEIVDKEASNGKITGKFMASIGSPIVKYTKDGYNNGGTFGSKLHNYNIEGGTPNFNEVFKLTLNLKEVIENGGSKYLMIDSKTDKAATSERKAEMFQDFFDDIGLYGYTGKKLVEEALKGKKIYLRAEPIASYIQVKNNKGEAVDPRYLVGTATELRMWLDSFDHWKSVNRIMCLTVIKSAWLTTDGAGYYGIDEYVFPLASDPDSRSQANKDERDRITERMRTGNKIGGLVEGISVLGWSLSDLIEEDDGCDAIPEEEHCSKENYKECCSCSKGLESKYKNSKYLQNYYKSIGHSLFPSSCEKTGCSYELDVNIPNSCDISSSGKVSDKASWKCVFESTKSEESSVRENYYVGKNNYCAIYCKEEIELQLPTTGAYSYTGQYFVISNANSTKNNIGPVRFQAKTTCRVTDSEHSTKGFIDYERFKSEYSEANKKVAKTWDLYQIELKKEITVSKATTKKATGTNTNKVCREKCCDRSDCPCKCLSGGSIEGSKCVSYTTPVATTGDNCPEGYNLVGSNCKKTISNASCPTVSEKVNSCEVDKIEASGTEIYYPDTISYDGIYHDWSSASVDDVNCSVTTGQCYSLSCDSELTYDTDKAYKQYLNALNNRQKILDDIMYCNNFIYNDSTFEPIVELNYTDDTKYYYHEELISSKKSIGKTYYYNTGTSSSEISYTYSKVSSYTNTSSTIHTDDIVGNSAKINKYVCEKKGEKCKIQEIYYPSNTWVEQVTTNTYTYRLSNNSYRYVIKETGESVKSVGDAKNYNDLGFSHLPVHFSALITKPHEYLIIIKSFGGTEIDIPSKINKYTKYLINGDLFDGKSYKINDTYSCSYKLKTKPTYECIPGTDDPGCPDSDGGFDLIYRTISLYNPFPGKDGNSKRQIGYNWISDGESYSEKYITNNRGVNTYEIYKLDPLYEITLDPAMMTKIKEYNSKKNTEKGIFHGREVFLGYSDFTLNCKTIGSSKNKQCTSQVIRDWGVRGCAIKTGLSKYKDCGTNNMAW